MSKNGKTRKAAELAAVADLLPRFAVAVAALEPVPS